MADPLSQLRQFHINGREIREHNGYIIFGDHGWPKTVKTNYQVYSAAVGDGNRKEYYTLESLLYFLKHMDLAQPHYVKQAGRDNIPVVPRPDRKDLIAYLKGESQTSPSIDKNAPIPSSRLPAAEIYGNDQHSTGSLQASASSLQSSSRGQYDGSGRGDGSAQLAKKRAHDPEVEKKLREEFAARLYEPANKKLAAVIPSDGLDKSGDTSQSGGGGMAAINKFGAEKVAALRAKHLAVKRTTIIDADTDVSKLGSGASGPTNKEDPLFAVDSDKLKRIRSKEKIWRTRNSCLMAHSKDFKNIVVPMIDQLERSKTDDPRKLQSGQIPTVPLDTQSNNPYNNHPHHQVQQQQTIQKNTYNRYDQERFVKLDIGVEIDTKKSFVSGGANGLSGYNQGGSQAQQARDGPKPHHQASGPIGSGGPGGVGNSGGNVGSGTIPPAASNGSANRPIDVENRHSSRAPNNPNRPSKRTSTVPIIIIPATTTSLINMYNASAILQDLTYVDGRSNNRPRESEILIQRKKPDGTHAAYKIIDNPLKLDAEDWNRVVAVFAQGPAWQFKGWPWDGSPVEIFSRIKGFHLKWDEAKLETNVEKWNVQIMELSRNKRHLDKATLLKFWSSLDSFMTKYKSFLKF